MNTTTYIAKKFPLRTLVAALALASATAHGAPGTLVDSPLFLSNTVQPNILFVIDDSGSMFWEDLLNKGTFDPGEAILSESTVYNPPGPYTDWWDFTLRRLFCHGFNSMAYNPSATYTPWQGVDSAGNPHGNMTLAAARTNPYNPGVTKDIRGHYYWVWNDMDSDGAYDGPGSTDSGAAANTATDECGDVSSNTGGVLVTTLSSAQQTNYANWYSYYRKREFVAKRAVSELVKNSATRMGLSTLHNNNTVRTLIADVDDITTPIDTTAQTNKQTLLNNVFRINSSGGTPLRSALQAAGEYFANGNGWGSSPIQSAAQGGSCQQNFTVLMSDGYWNSDSTLNVGNQDSAPTPWAGGSYADGVITYENTLADVAMKYYKEDLSTLTDNVPVTSVDPQNLTGDKMHQHMVTFTAAFGVDGTLTTWPTNATDAFNWPQPVADTQTAVDDMRHAAWNGRGDFLSAQDPQTLINGLNAALAAISGRTSSAASVAFNSGSLSANSQVYLALFNSDKWSGDLKSYALDPESGAVASTPSWSAALTPGDALIEPYGLDPRDLDTNPRTILTWNGEGVPFQWANLSTAQKNDFRTNTTGGTDNEATGKARFSYVRGDRVCEESYPGDSTTLGTSSVATCSYSDGTNTYNTANFRPRASRLGDIVHSAPVYVGKPAYGWPDTLTGTTPYANFKLAQANRAGMIYIGANDGMLHGFAESGGSEVMAYVPSTLYSTTAGSGLHALSEPNYNHKFYVDLTPSVVDAYVKTSSTDTVGWKSVLVGGLRAGGRGVFALDVTSPSTFSESGTTPADKVMWEFTSADDADLGYTFSQVAIVPMNNGKWAAIFGNGYNSSGTGMATLFILFIEAGLDGSWTGNGDYIKISVPTANTNSTTPNGLASPAVIDTNGDFVADRIYAGDLLGNMWVFDITGNNTGNWGSAYKSGNGANATAVPLFTAPANQQITARPTIVRNDAIPTSNANTPNVLVLFGTGQYLVANDNSTTYQEAFYGIWDKGTGQLTQSSLVEQTIGTGSTSAGITGRTLTSLPVDYGNGDMGWFMNLPTSGERVVTSPVARGDNVYFSTMIPDTNACSYGGTSWLMVANSQTGGAPLEAAFDLDNDGVVDADDEIDEVGAAGEQKSGLASAPVNLGDTRYTSTTETIDGVSIEQDKIEDLSSDRTGRLSWEELIRQ